MGDMTEHQKTRALLCSWYDRVIAQASLLKADDRALREARSNLRANRFIVAVCGEMNSGKSTLLNALLFEDELLPAYITTMTAKIVVMRGGSPEGVTATLYTPDEFRRVVDKVEGDGGANDEMVAAREKARAEGLRESELLQTPARTEKSDELGKIVRFAAVHNRGGTWSVYVNYIDLIADRPWLHEVTVADTPGVNDPNPERDKITRKWIRRADAVVYVTYAGQAGMTDSDVEFLDREIAHISPDRRIIAVNKCDVSNPEAVWSHINKIRQSDDRRKVLLKDDDGIVLVSGLGGLIAAMQGAGRPLSSTMEHHASRLAKSGYLDAERNGLETLRKRIEERIIKTKGDQIIESHRGRLSDVLEKAVRREQLNVDMSKDRLDDMDKSSAEIECKIKCIEESQLWIGGLVKKARTKIKNAIDELSETDESMDKIRSDIMENVEERLKKGRNVNDLPAQASWIVPDEIYNRRSRLTTAIRARIRNIQPVLNDAETDLSNGLRESGLGERFTKEYLLPVSARKICDGMEKHLKETLVGSKLTEAVHRATGMLGRAFNTKEARKNAVDSLISKIGPVVNSAFKDIFEHLNRELTNMGQEAINSMESSCSEILDRRKKELERQTQLAFKSEEEKVKVRRELQEAEHRTAQVEQLQTEYRQAVGD